MENWRFYPYESTFLPGGQTAGMLLTFRGSDLQNRGGQMKSEQGGQMLRNIHWAILFILMGINYLSHPFNRNIQQVYNLFVYHTFIMEF